MAAHKGTRNHHVRPPLPSNKPGFMEAHAADLAAIVLDAARTYTDHHLERAVVLFASATAKRSSVFAKALASGVVKQVASRCVRVRVCM